MFLHYSPAKVVISFGKCKQKLLNLKKKYAIRTAPCGGNTCPAVKICRTSVARCRRKRYLCRLKPDPNEKSMELNQHTLPNGLRIIQAPSATPVAYGGFTIDAGTRDEADNEQGMAHFVEHLIFKGTEKRRAWHILNRMERVGGDLNASRTRRRQPSIRLSSPTTLPGRWSCLPTSPYSVFPSQESDAR